MTNFISFPLRKTACLVPGFSFWKRQVALKGTPGHKHWLSPERTKGKRTLLPSYVAASLQPRISLALCVCCTGITSPQTGTGAGQNEWIRDSSSLSWCPCSAKPTTLVPFIFFLITHFPGKHVLATLFLFSFWILRFEENGALFEI